MAKDEPASYRNTNKKEEMGLDRAHYWKAKNPHCKPRIKMESARQAKGSQDDPKILKKISKNKRQNKGSDSQASPAEKKNGNPSSTTYVQEWMTQTPMTGCKSKSLSTNRKRSIGPMPKIRCHTLNTGHGV